MHTDMGKSRLRTKTGCLSCRKRKTKCGEEKPICCNCASSNRRCDWPSAADLRDRRHLTRRQRAGLSVPYVDADSPSSSTPAHTKGQEGVEVVAEKFDLILAPSLGSMAPAIRSQVELDLVYHFLNKFFSLLVLPTWNTSHFLEYQFQLVNMMMHHDNVKYAVLASCAANKYILSNHRRYQNLALIYYSKAVKGVSDAVLQLHSQNRAPDDSLLATVVYLYLHDLWGLDTVVDPRKHVTGAMKLLNLRYNDGSSPLSMERPFDRLTAESVLYQAFLLAARRPFSPNFHVDSEFLVRSESILDCRKLLDILPTDSYPVLGVPLALFYHILDIIDFHDTMSDSKTSGIHLRTSTDYWEAVILNGSVMDYCPPYMSSFYADTVTLYVLAASILLNWVMNSSTTETSRAGILGLLDRPSGTNDAGDTSTWQFESALGILRKDDFVEPWSRCFIGAWPMMIFGYAATKEEDVSLIRSVLKRIWHQTGYGEIQRIMDELETRWATT